MVKELSSSEYKVNMFDKYNRSQTYSVKHISHGFEFHSNASHHCNESTFCMRSLSHFYFGLRTGVIWLVALRLSIAKRTWKGQTREGYQSSGDNYAHLLPEMMEFRYLSYSKCLLVKGVGGKKKREWLKLNFQQCLLLHQKSNGTKKGRTPRRRRAWDGGGKNHTNSDNIKR